MLKSHFVSKAKLRTLFAWSLLNFYHPQRCCGIVMFTARKRSLGQGNIFTPVCHSVHRGVPGPRGVSAPGGCLLWGVPGPGGCLVRGVCFQRVPGPGGCLVWEGIGSQGGLLLGVGGAWWRLPQMTTAAGSTHPTGMHSCFTSVCQEFCPQEGVSVPACTTGHMTKWGLCPGEGLCPAGLCPGGLCPGVFVQGSICQGGLCLKLCTNAITNDTKKNGPL